MEGLFIPNDAPPELVGFAAAVDFYAIYPLTDAASLDPNYEANFDSTLTGCLRPGFLGVAELAAPVVLIAVDGLVPTLEEVDVSCWL